jgi:UDPglucose--hexose-1-phosphate uridylyltransferase
MKKIRKDYILDRYVIFSTKRGVRPDSFQSVKEQEEKLLKEKGEFDKDCFFCPGNEDLTPPEIDRVGDNKSWEIRVFPNKFPAVESEEKGKFVTQDQYFKEANAYGFHEVVAETPIHNDDFSNYSVDRRIKLIEVFKKRVTKLREKKGINYVSVFKNYGPKAGASLDHPHSQIIGSFFIPQIIQIKEEKSKNNCPYCEIVKLEARSERKCFENQHFLAFTPYASRLPYEIAILPKRHLIDFNDLNKKEIEAFAKIQKKVFNKIAKLSNNYNFYFQYGIKRMHFQFYLMPRIGVWAGYELGFETIVNSVSPEQSAEFYRS